MEDNLQISEIFNSEQKYHDTDKKLIQILFDLVVSYHIIATKIFENLTQRLENELEEQEGIGTSGNLR